MRFTAGWRPTGACGACWGATRAKTRFRRPSAGPKANRACGSDLRARQAQNEVRSARRELEAQMDAREQLAGSARGNEVQTGKRERQVRAGSQRGRGSNARGNCEARAGPQARFKSRTGAARHAREASSVRGLGASSPKRGSLCAAARQNESIS
ncbi:hypothetical protein GH714_028413 [Hevea brasiliensis]|uniref:Uncharacterized protein n=1 Tax=Hevea brasiliensis TaxID=3981 RepID=A0A6A6KEB3_HEVBR|nr:hypothetical protein GH714_028413 [Hevea brasiliensis]